MYIEVVDTMKGLVTVSIFSHYHFRCFPKLINIRVCLLFFILTHLIYTDILVQKLQQAADALHQKK